jgi:hypothetical protein
VCGKKYTPTHTDTTEENLPQRKLDRGNRMLNKKKRWYKPANNVSRDTINMEWDNNTRFMQR